MRKGFTAIELVLFVTFVFIVTYGLCSVADTIGRRDGHALATMDETARKLAPTSYEVSIPHRSEGAYTIRLMKLGDTHDYFVVNTSDRGVTITHAVGCRECAKLNK